MGAGAALGAGCVLGPYVYVEGDCRIGDGARLTEAVVLRDAMIPPGANIAGAICH